MEYGTPIQRAAMDAQESVRKAIESMTGLHVVRVDVHVQSVSFEKENSALQAGAASAALEAGEYIHETLPVTEPETEKKPEEKKTETPEQKEAADEPGAAAEDETAAEEKTTGNSKKKTAKGRKNPPAGEPKEETAGDPDTTAE